MKVFDDEKDKLMDHSYDGIKELDNHMPTWWLWLFYFTIAFGVGYMLYYQVLGWGPTQHEEYQQEIAAAEAKYGAPEENSVEDFTWAVNTEEADIAAGKELFMKPSQLCFTCHGNNGEGLVGPNLTDNQWMHGCQPKDLAVSIIEGYPDQGMLPYGSGTKISNEQVQSLISYIASIQGSEPANAKEADMSRTQPCNEGPLAQSDS